LSVPSDLSIVGIDGLFLSAISNPRLTTVRLPVTEMARAMVEQAMTRECPPDTSSEDRVFNTTLLIERESVAAPPAATPSTQADKRNTST
jgi:DNA-binding LacI/PurR family transcriptional regulator